MAKPKDETWKRVKDVVDKTFQMTKAAREQMTAHLDTFSGKIWKEESLKPTDSRAFINMVFSTVEGIAPMLTDNPPIWLVIPKKGYLSRLATVYNNALSYAWNTEELDLKSLLVALDAMIMKAGLYKTVWDPFEYKIVTEVVDPRDFFIAPGYDDEWKAPFCGEVSLRPLSWVKMRFPDIKEIEVDGSDFENWKGRKVMFSELEDFEGGVQYCKVYSVWCRNDSDMDLVLEDFKDTPMADTLAKRKKKGKNGPYFMYFTPSTFLGYEPDMADHGRPPYVRMVNYHVPHQFLGLAEPDQMGGLNQELNYILQKVTGFLRRIGNPNFEVDANKYADIDELKKSYFEGGQFYSVDNSQNPGVPAVKVIQEAQLNEMIPQVINLIMGIIEEISGQTDISKGRASKRDRQSASEVSILYEASHTRTRQKVRNFEFSLKRVAWLHIRLMQQFYAKPMDFYIRRDNEVVYDQIGNSRQFAEGVIMSQPVKDKYLAQAQMTAEEQQEAEDYKKLITSYGAEDPVLFDFDVEIETNSTLPMDKQALANLGLRLFEMQAIDREALLKIVKFPEAQQIAQRMQEAESQQGAPGGREASPQNPADVQEFMNLAQGGPNG